MRSSMGIFLLLASSFTVAQSDHWAKVCNPAAATTISHNNGITVQKVILSGKWGHDPATVYLPDKAIAEAGIVFSHSAIHHDYGTIDLQPLARTLASGGAAVIVPERSLVWLPLDLSSERDGPVVICAARWLIDHTKVFNDGKPIVNENNVVVRKEFAYVGPLLCDPTGSADCERTDPFAYEYHSHYYRDSVWVPLGETSGGDNTNSIISDQGLKVAHTLQETLGLAPINSEELKVAQTN